MYETYLRTRNEVATKYSHIDVEIFNLLLHVENIYFYIFNIFGNRKHDIFVLYDHLNSILNI